MPLWNWEDSFQKNPKSKYSDPLCLCIKLSHCSYLKLFCSSSFMCQYRACLLVNRTVASVLLAVKTNQSEVCETTWTGQHRDSLQHWFHCAHSDLCCLFSVLQYNPTSTHSPQPPAEFLLNYLCSIFLKICIFHDHTFAFYNLPSVFQVDNMLHNSSVSSSLHWNWQELWLFERLNLSINPLLGQMCWRPKIS